MDDICVWLNRLANWCDQSPLPAIPYAGFAGGGYGNPPAEHLELAYMIRGQIDDLQIGSRRVCIPQGSLALHNVHFGNVSKRPKAGQSSACLFLDVAGVREFASLARKPLFCCMPIKHDQRIVSLFEKISTLCLLSGVCVSYLEPRHAYDPQQSSLSQRLHVKGAVLELLAALIEEASPDEGNALDVPLTSIVGMATTFMARAYMDPQLDLGRVAQSVPVHRDHLGRLFRKQLGMTPLQYLKRLRINRAILLLRHSTLSIREIAREVGFSDPFHFSRVFHQQTGQCARNCRSDSEQR